jgi:hypothetical protein
MVAAASNSSWRIACRLIAALAAMLIASCAVKDPPDLATIRKRRRCLFRSALHGRSRQAWSRLDGSKAGDGS